MTTASAHPNPEDIMAWSDQELGAQAAARVRGHVDDCAACQALAGDLRAVRAQADRWLVEPAPSSVRATVLSAAAADRAVPARPSAGTAPAGFWRRYRWQLVAASAVITVVFVGAQVSLCGEVVCRLPMPQPQATEPSAQSTALVDFQTASQARPRVDLGVPDDGAAVVVVWVVDYECPSCAINDPAFTALTEQYAASKPGQVKFVIEDWPWNTECNPNVATTFVGHEASCTAAVAMHLAEKHGTAAAMKTWLFSHQGATSAEVREAAASVGGITDFHARYPAQLTALRARLTALAAAGIKSTPSGFVNGVLVNDAKGVISAQTLGRAIATELKKPRKR